MSDIRARIAALGIRQGVVAEQLGMHETLLSTILNERRQPPEDFEATVNATLDRLEKAEKAAAEARERVLAGIEEDTAKSA